MAWDKICVPLEEGGLGFRDFNDFNLALLAKQVWRLLIYPDSFLSRVLKGRYYRHSNPLITGKANNPSYGWSSLMSSRHLLDKALKRTIGNGSNTKVWEDIWIQTEPAEPARPAKPRNALIDPYLKVHHLIDFDLKEWNVELVHDLIADEDIPRILAMRISRTNRRDSYVWKYSKSGNYTVRT